MPSVARGVAARAKLGVVLGNVFQEVRMGASLTDGRTWHPIHSWPDVIAFEYAHGVERRRDGHNVRSMARALREKRPVVTEHAGFYDLYASVGSGGDSLLVTGPFAVARPTSGELESRWRWLTGAQARATDPEFARYLACTLATAMFQAPMLDVLLQFALVFCRLLAEDGDVDALAREASSLRAKLAGVRFVERCWECASELVDERISRAWTSPNWESHLSFLGANRPPSHAVVALAAGRPDDADAIGQILRRDAYQRAAVDLCRRLGGIVCGRVGDHGVALLVDQRGEGPRAQAALADLAEKARTLARKFDLVSHAGISDVRSEARLPERYEAALAAAERALSLGQAVIVAERRGPRVVSPLGELRRELVRTVGATRGTLRPRFDRYLEAVAVRCGYRLEPMRAHIEAGFDQIIDALRMTGALDERSLLDLREPLQRAADARTVTDLFLAYRRAVFDVELAALHPREARHDRSVRRATAFIREHSAESLSLSRVARVAGFAPTYFSKIFAKAEKTTLTRYVQRIRVERAKSMLESTSLGVEQIGHLCGFRTRSSFHLAFQEIAGKTPGSYRGRSRGKAKGRTKKS